MTIKDLFYLWTGGYDLEIMFMDSESGVSEQVTYRDYKGGNTDYGWGAYEVAGMEVYPNYFRVVVIAGAERRSLNIKSVFVRDFVQNIDTDTISVDIWDMDGDTADNYDSETTTLRTLKSGGTKYSWLNRALYGWAIEDGALNIVTEMLNWRYT